MSSNNSNSKVARQQNLYLAKLAEQAERYDEMVQFMQSFVLAPEVPSSDLSVEERTLFSSAVKKVVASHRAAWRIVSAILKRDPTPVATDYLRRIEVDLAAFCNDVLRLLDFILVPSAVSVESKVFFLKMKGDYNRYLAEFLLGDEKTAAADETMLAYSAGHELATAELSPTNPTRLGLSLNFSVFYYEILEESEKACNIAKKAFEEANEDVENGGEEVQKDSNLIMQLLWDNLTLWTKEHQEKLDDSEKLV